MSASKDLHYGLRALRFRMHCADVSASGSRYGSICYVAFLLVTPKASFHERAARHVIFLQNKKLHPRLTACLTRLTLNLSDSRQKKKKKKMVNYKYTIQTNNRAAIHKGVIKWQPWAWINGTVHAITTISIIDDYYWYGYV